MAESILIYRKIRAFVKYMHDQKEPLEKLFNRNEYLWRGRIRLAFHLSEHDDLGLTHRTLEGGISLEEYAVLYKALIYVNELRRFPSLKELKNALRG